MLRYFKWFAKNGRKTSREMVVVPLCAIVFALGVARAQAGYLEPGLESRLQHLPQGERLTVIVHLAERADFEKTTKGIVGRNKAERSKRVIEVLQAIARESQRDILSYLENKQATEEVERIRSFWVFNGLAASATKEIIYELAARDDVDWISQNRPIPLPELLPGKQIPTIEVAEWNIQKIRAPEVWDLGYDGTGIVVGSFDSGVDWNHRDLSTRYRGGSNSWYDPYGQHSTPFDNNGHGTHTTGIILGGNASGRYIGVAPGARWIAAKGWNDLGQADTEMFHLIFQWFMDPDENPGTPDAPDVVNNSWSRVTSGCQNEFRDDCRAWVAAGIFPAFCAGNYGAGSYSVRSPGNYPWNEDEVNAFAMGATDSQDGIWSSSSRGPSPCNQEICPEASAPGVNVKSAWPGGDYNHLNGTSMACPHLTGSIALLLDIDPELTLAELGDALQNAAVDLGIPGEDNDYGAGRLELLKELFGTVYDGNGGPLTAGVPYLVTGDVVVPSGQTLTIHRGAQIFFESGSKIVGIGTIITSGESNISTKLFSKDTPRRGMKLLTGLRLQNGWHFKPGE